MRDLVSRAWAFVGRSHSLLSFFMTLVAFWGMLAVAVNKLDARLNTRIDTRTDASVMRFYIEKIAPLEHRVIEIRSDIQDVKSAIRRDSLFQSNFSRNSNPKAYAKTLRDLERWRLNP